MLIVAVQSLQTSAEDWIYIFFATSFRFNAILFKGKVC